MNVNKEINGALATLKIEGRIDTTTAPTLDSAIQELTGDVKELVLDMSGVEYVSSAGLRVLLAAQKKMNAIGSMKLIGVCAAVMEVFEITGFSDILTIE